MDCQCTTKHESSTMHDGVNTVLVLPSPVNVCKNIFISNNLFYRLIDTGSKLTLLKHSAWIKLGTPSLMTNIHTLTGCGFSCTKMFFFFS